MTRHRTKILCTIGPASEHPKTIRAMLRGGMDGARLNFSHGSRQWHASVYNRLRDLSTETNSPLCILQDLQGIKIRITDVESPFRLNRGEVVRVAPGTERTSHQCIVIDYPHLLKDLKRGDRILIDDGLITLVVRDKGAGGLRAVVKEGGIISSRKGVNLPDSRVSLSPFTDKDREDLEFGLSLGVDYVALSFVRSHREVKALKEWMAGRGHQLPVIAKIERPEAVSDIDRILDLSEGIMVARGDLGVEMPPEEVPLIQKELIIKANSRGRLVITATQMLESMKEHTRPTRAEVTDVANAVLDGSDVLMLSAETSAGRYPVQAVKMMQRIISATEKRPAVRENLFRHNMLQKRDDMSFAVADAAVRAAEDIRASYIVALTESGYTAMLISKLRPSVPVIAFTPEERVLRVMRLFWGVSPFMMERKAHWDEMVSEVVELMRQRGLIRRTETLVIVGGDPPGMGMTNIMKIIRAGV